MKNKIEITSGLLKTVHVYVVIDESGSMSSRTSSVISGVNEYVNDLKTKNDNINYVLNVVKFNTKSTFSVENQPIALFEKFWKYKPSGGTALLDAVGNAIVAADKKQATDAIFIILTDGEENSSHEYSTSKIKSMIEDRQSKGWVFTYLGADASAWNVAHDLGIHRGNTQVWDLNNTFGVLRACSAVTSNYYSASTGTTMNCNNLYEEAGIKDFTKLAETLANK